MSTQRRRVVPVQRARRVPARSRVTVRRADPPLGKSASLAAALRASRVALSRLEGELGELLSALGDRGTCPDADAPNRLRAATSVADAALASLRAFARR